MRRLSLLFYVYTPPSFELGDVSAQSLFKDLIFFSYHRRREETHSRTVKTALLSHFLCLTDFCFLLLSVQMAKINRREHTRQIKKLSSSRLTCASQHRNQSTLQQRWLVSACLSLSFHLVCSSAEAQIDWKHSTFRDPTLGQKRNENEGGPCLSVGMNGLPVYWCCL